MPSSSVTPPPVLVITCLTCDTSCAGVATLSMIGCHVRLLTRCSTGFSTIVPLESGKFSRDARILSNQCDMANHNDYTIPKCVNTRSNYQFNLFTYRIETASLGPATSAPSTANARLQVTGSSCHLARSLPASRRCSDGPGFDHRDCAGHGFFMMRDVAVELLVSAEVITGFRCTRF